MTEGGESALAVTLPEGFDRRSRLGPFPSATDALKFLVVGAAGAVLALRFGLLWWTPFLAGGFLLAVHRAEDRPLDERFAEYLTWRCRRRRPGAAGGPLPAADGDRPPRPAGLEVGGIPVAYLPPHEAERLFDSYRAFLRRVPGTLLLRVTSVPLPAGPFRPAAPARGTPEERAARSGYLELVELLARRKRRRVVRIQLPARAGSGPSGAAEELAALTDLLQALEIPFRRLSPADLARGWRAPPGAGGRRPP